MDSVLDHALNLVNFPKSLLGYFFEIIGNKDQMDIPAFIESSDKLP